MGDCVTYSLNEEQGLKYIEKFYGRIAHTTYSRWKMKIQSEDTTNLWLNQFTRIGFVEKHRMLIEDAEKVYKDSLNRYFVESIRNPPDKRLVLRLEFNFRENGRYLAELMEGTPIIAAIKSQLSKGNEPNNGISEIQEGNITQSTNGNNEWV